MEHRILVNPGPDDHPLRPWTDDEDGLLELSLVLQSANALPAAQVLARARVPSVEDVAALGRANFMAYLQTYAPPAIVMVGTTRLDATVETLLARMPPREVRIVTDHFARWPVTVSGNGYDPSVRRLLSPAAIAEVQAVQTSWETRIAVGDPTVPYAPSPAVLADHRRMLTAAERTLAHELGDGYVVRASY